MNLRERIDAFITATPHGWCTSYKARWLAEVILKEKLNHVVEVGVFTGRSLIPMGMAVKELDRGGFVLGIDPYNVERQVESVYIPRHIDWARSIPFESILQSTLLAIREYKVSSHCGLVRVSSEEIAPIIGTLDLVHIDGCHSVLASCRDVETWLPKVRSGGLVVLDDANWSTVQDARSMLVEACGKPGYEKHDHEQGESWEVYRVR